MARKNFYTHQHGAYDGIKLLGLFGHRLYGIIRLKYSISGMSLSN